MSGSEVKLDENLGNRAIEFFREAGHDVATVSEQSPGSTSDDGMIEVRRTEERLLVSSRSPAKEPSVSDSETLQWSSEGYSQEGRGFGSIWREGSPGHGDRQKSAFHRQQGAMMDEATVIADGVEVAYRQSGGTGAPVLFIHGNSSSSGTWLHQLDGRVGETFHCTAMDLPGHGRSAARPDPVDYSLPGYAAVVTALASALEIEEAVLVGWSLGGHIALEALAALPRCRGVLIFGTPPLGVPPALEEGFLPNPAMSVGFSEEVTAEDARAYARSFLAPGSSVRIDDFVRDIEATDGAARSGLQASVGELRMADELEIEASMTQPLAILQGAEEQLVSTPYLQSVEAPTLWRGEVQMIPGAGHAPHVETPNRFDALLTEFVQECQAEF